MRQSRRIRDRVFGPEDDPHGWDEALNEANIPDRYRRGTIDGVPGGTRQWAKKMLDAPEQWLGVGHGFLMVGNLGIGKSTLAGLFALDAIRRCEVVLWLSSRSVPGVIFRDGERNAELHNRLVRADLLVLDDLGAEAYCIQKAGGSALEEAIRIVYDRDRSIVVTSNLSPARLVDKYPEPMMSVLGRMTDEVEVK